MSIIIHWSNLSQSTHAGTYISYFEVVHSTDTGTFISYFKVVHSTDTGTYISYFEVVHSTDAGTPYRIRTFTVSFFSVFILIFSLLYFL